MHKIYTPKMGSSSHQKVSTNLLIVYLMIFMLGLVKHAVTISTTEMSITTTSVTSQTSVIPATVPIQSTSNDDDLSVASSGHLHPLANAQETSSSSSFSLDKAESNGPTKNTVSPQKLEIIKQIRRLNNDGSYTVGYEADDGTFKIESRDVLGNIKGTYGYVDINGEIKRVSYVAASNGTVTAPPTIPAMVAQRQQQQPLLINDNNNNNTGDDDNQVVNDQNDEIVPNNDHLVDDDDNAKEPSEQVIQIPRQNKTGFIATASTTRRPAALAYLTTSASSPTRASVIQAIPKKRILLTASSERPTYHHYSSIPPRKQDYATTASPFTQKISVGGEPTTTVVYATSVPSSLNRTPIHIRPTLLPTMPKTVEQIARPDKLEINDNVSKVQISTHRDNSPTKPVKEEIDERDNDDEPQQQRGPFVRRQLNDNSHQEHHEEKYEAAQQQVIYSQSSGDDSSQLYGGGSSRSLFTTTSPRIPSVVLAARSRAALLQNVINNQQHQQQQQQQQEQRQQQQQQQQQQQLQQKQQVTTDKVYVKPPRRRQETRLDNEQSTEPSSENQYISKRPIQNFQSNSQRDVQVSEEEKRVYRRPIISSNQKRQQQQKLLKQQQQHQEQPVAQPQRHREFIRQAPPQDFDYGGPKQFRIPIPEAAFPPQTVPSAYQRSNSYVEENDPTDAVNDAIEEEEEQLQQQHHYLRETTLPQKIGAAATPYPHGLNESPNEDYVNQPIQPRGRQYLPYIGQQQQQQEPHQRQQQQSRQTENSASAYEEQALPYPQNPYSPYNYRSILPSQYYQNPDRPLTVRDFERLLNLLVIRHQQVQRYNPLSPHINPYLLGGGVGGVGGAGGAVGYGGYPNQFGYQQIPRPPIYNNPYDLRYNGYRALYGDYSEPQQKRYQEQGTSTSVMDQQTSAYQNPVQIGLKKRPTYQAEVPSDQQHQQTEFLPSDIREELLYRMLLLAMTPGGGRGSNSIENSNMQIVADQQAGSSPAYATVNKGTNVKMLAATTDATNQRKPVRSVQILGDDEE